MWRRTEYADHFVAVNVGRVKTVYPFHIILQVDSHHPVDLLHTMESDKIHYVLVKTLSQLGGSQLSAYGHSLHICPYCLDACSTEDILERHVERCGLHGTQHKVIWKERWKVKRDNVKFTKVEYQLRLLFVMHADIKSILKEHGRFENDQQLGQIPITWSFLKTFKAGIFFL